ncbi:MAG: hypothetical protein ACRD2F_14290 [Terriglobales bacterium]
MAGKSFSDKTDGELVVGTPLELSALMRRLRRGSKGQQPEETTVYLPGGAVFHIRNREPGSSDKPSKR